MNVHLYPHQLKAIGELETGYILRGGVGSGKSRTALAYYYQKEKPKKLFIITTARKRDTSDWIEELKVFNSTSFTIDVCVDSWNNVKKYVNVEGAFFIFDEQRAVGYGAWVKAFLKITKKNNWILLSATPGDIWMDYVPVFIANNFYKNKTEFVHMHVVYSYRSKFPKIERYINQSRLNRIRDKITVNMPFDRHTTQHHIPVIVPHDENKFFLIKDKRWNVFENQPIKDISEAYRLMRQLVNSDMQRVFMVKQLASEHKKTIIFYNFNYELELLRTMAAELKFTIAEWNGHKHEVIPTTDNWIYLVQYTAGAEGWNCVETNKIIFYSQNYSYKVMNQAAGRIDRLNTPFTDLYYYHIRSKSFIDKSIARALDQKQTFHEEVDWSSREKHML